MLSGERPSERPTYSLMYDYILVLRQSVRSHALSRTKAFEVSLSQVVVSCFSLLRRSEYRVPLLFSPLDFLCAFFLFISVGLFTPTGVGTLPTCCFGQYMDGFTIATASYNRLGR